MTKMAPPTKTVPYEKPDNVRLTAALTTEPLSSAIVMMIIEKICAISPNTNENSGFKKRGIVNCTTPATNK